MPRPPLRILLVEDYEPARRGLIDKLTEAGFRIAGEAALDRRRPRRSRRGSHSTSR